MADDTYHFDQLIREILVSRFQGQRDAEQDAALIAKNMIVVGIVGTGAAGSGQPPRESVRLITKGMMEGTVLIEGDAALAAVEILREMADAAQEVSLDPADMMTWAMEGIADSASILDPARVLAVQNAIEAAFMGAGEVFGKLRSGGRA